jgi:hypothetical protein
MSNALHLINIIITTIGAAAWTLSSVILLTVIRLSAKRGIIEHEKELKIALMVCGGSALYMWSIFAELTK